MMIENNNCSFVGTIHNIEDKVTPKGTRIVTAGVALYAGKNDDGSFKDSIWANIKAFEKTAERMATIPEKSKVMVKCRFAPGSWEGKDGQKHTRVEFIVDGIEELVKYQYSAGQGQQSYSRPSPAPARHTEPDPEPADDYQPDDEDSDSDIPF